MSQAVLSTSSPGARLAITLWYEIIYIHVLYMWECSNSYQGNQESSILQWPAIVMVPELTCQARSVLPFHAASKQWLMGSYEHERKIVFFPGSWPAWNINKKSEGTTRLQLQWGVNVGWATCIFIVNYVMHLSQAMLFHTTIASNKKLGRGSLVPKSCTFPYSMGMRIVYPCVRMSQKEVLNTWE